MAEAELAGYRREGELTRRYSILACVCAAGFALPHDNRTWLSVLPTWDLGVPLSSYFRTSFEEYRKAFFLGILTEGR